jgi:2-keto-4-pentenoate hydratase/2-oxohepta-3-ene-1,7-dioic acid hydratase in catechol pathway
MGAAAYDGFGVEGDLRRPGQNHVSISFERVGTLQHDLVYPDEPRAKQRGGQSPYLHRRRQLGLPSSDMPELKPDDIPAVTRALWAIMYNTGRRHDPEYPAPYLYPRTSLRRAEDPITLGPAHRDVEISVQLAAVIGPEPQFHVAADEVMNGLLGLGLFIGVADLGIQQRGTDDPNVSSYYFGYFQARFGDGFNRIARPVPLDALDDRWRQASMAIEVEEHGAAEGSVADYDTGIERMIEWISDGVTMLPGDIAVLGPSRAAVTLPVADKPGGSWWLRARIEGLTELETRIEDRRDLGVPNWHRLKIGPPNIT